jgi:hypothetical protein
MVAVQPPFLSFRRFVMRTLLKVTLPPGTGNETDRPEEMPRFLDAMMKELKPEAAYFYPENGRRTSLIIFDLKETSQMPAISERLTRKLGAEVLFSPVMNFEELKKGLEQASHLVAAH